MTVSTVSRKPSRPRGRAPTSCWRQPIEYSWLSVCVTAGTTSAVQTGALQYPAWSRTDPLVSSTDGNSQGRSDTVLPTGRRLGGPAYLRLSSSTIWTRCALVTDGVSHGACRGGCCCCCCRCAGGGRCPVGPSLRYSVDDAEPSRGGDVGGGGAGRIGGTAFCAARIRTDVHSKSAAPCPVIDTSSADMALSMPDN